MQPGGAIVLDNWMPTMKGARCAAAARGGAYAARDDAGDFGV